MKSTLLVSKDKFEEIVRFAMKAVKDGFPDNEIWATVEVMSSDELQASIEESDRDLEQSLVRRFDSHKDAKRWLSSLRAVKKP
ncbi:MAG: hypothetical protein HYU39_07830 [Thaumarchaeota archaeon]|nr:hypothetical protein [Nitrososphaerota archaeon]